MYLQNSLYSNIDLYLNELNKYLKENYELKANYKTYDKQKDDDVTFIIFDIKSKLKNKDNKFIINEFNYEGNLVFVYNKLLNQVIIKEVPTINYNNKIKLPIFTSDLANILVDKLSKFIDKENINIDFQNNLSVIAIDDTVKDIIASIKDTRNYKILNIILETIKKEIKKIRQDVLNQKAHYDRVERSKERAINKKRVILGINPLDYESEEKFNKVLNARIKEAYIRKHDKAKRHLELSINKYKELLDNEKLYDYFNYILEMYITEYSENEYPIECKDIILNAHKEFKNYLKKNVNDTINSFDMDFYIDNYLDDWLEESNFYERYKKKFIDAVYNFDFNNEMGSLNTIKKLQNIINEYIENNNKHHALDSDEMIKWFCIELYDLKESWLANEEEKVNLKYHPIFYDMKMKYQLERRRNYYSINENDDSKICFNIIAPFYKSHEVASGFNLLHQIPELERIEKECNDVIQNIDNAILDFRTFSANWGNIIEKPYWIINDISYKISDYSNDDIYKLFMIKPGVKNINFSDILEINRGLSKKLLRGDFADKNNLLKLSSNNGRLIITISKSLNYNTINKILDNIQCEKNESNSKNSINEDYDNSYINWLNVICESFDTYLYVKSVLIKKIIKDDILPTRIFVNYDPEYYKNYLVNTPINYEFGHKYDYTSNYKYKRKYMLDLRGQYNFARDYINNILKINFDSKEYLKVLYTLLFGSFTDEEKYKKYYDDFINEIKSIENLILDYDYETPLIYNWFNKANNEESTKHLEKTIKSNNFTYEDLPF